MITQEHVQFAKSCPPEVMRMLSKMALRTAMDSICKQITELAPVMEKMEGVTGHRATAREVCDALIAAIQNTNERVWGKEGKA